MIIKRRDYLSAIRARWEDYLIVALPEPKQTGKTTMARLLVKNIAVREIHHFNLESPADLARLSLI